MFSHLNELLIVTAQFQWSFDYPLLYYCPEMINGWKCTDTSNCNHCPLIDTITYSLVSTLNNGTQTQHLHF